MDYGSLSMVLIAGILGDLVEDEVVVDRVLETRLAECTQAADGDCLMRLAAFEEAATAFEQHDLLAAIRLRRELGQADRAYADALDFLRRFPRDPRVGDVAQEALHVGEQIEAAGDEAMVGEHYESYLRDFKPLGGWDGFVVAHAKLGALRMRESCPIRDYLGACVEITKVRKECAQTWRRESDSSPRLFWGESAKRHARDPRKLGEAKRHLRLALDETSLQKAERDAAGSPARLRALANARAEAVSLSASEEWDAYLALGEVPWDLDFTQPSQFDNPCEARWKKARSARSSRRFMQWLTDMQDGFERIRSRYQKAILAGGPEASLAATARFALVTSRLVEGLAGGSMMALECGESGGVDKLEPLEDNVVSASDRCARLATTFGIGDDWAAYCRWELQRYKPFEYHQIIELSPAPIFMSHVRDDLDYRPVVVDKVDAPPRLRSRPPKRRCLERERPQKGTGRLGVLKMNEGSHLAPIFGRDTSTPERLAYPDDFLSKLTARFPPPWSH